MNELTLKGYAVSLATNSFDGLKQIYDFNFDLILVKLALPDKETKELVREIKRVDPDSIIIVLCDNYDKQIIEDLKNLGVYDFLIRPISLEKLFLLARKGIELHTFLVGQHKFLRILEEKNTSLQKQNLFLNKRIEELTKNLTRLYDNLRNTYMRTIRALAQALDAKDHYTHRHSENVASYAVRIAEIMGLSVQEIDIIRVACELHDIGKIGILDTILDKNGELTEEEVAQIRQHSLKGAQILEPLNFLEEVVVLVRQHHENYDGTGYPHGLRGEEIVLGARIIRLADAYDAMTSARAYRKIPLSKEEAIEEIKRNSGTQFDPKVVEAFLKIAHTL